MIEELPESVKKKISDWQMRTCNKYVLEGIARLAFSEGKKVERERAAKVCEELEAKTAKNTMRMQHHQGASLGASMCADRIRKGEG